MIKNVIYTPSPIVCLVSIIFLFDIIHKPIYPLIKVKKKFMRDLKCTQTHVSSEVQTQKIKEMSITFSPLRQTLNYLKSNIISKCLKDETNP